MNNVYRISANSPEIITEGIYESIARHTAIKKNSIRFNITENTLDSVKRCKSAIMGNSIHFNIEKNTLDNVKGRKSAIMGNSIHFYIEKNTHNSVKGRKEGGYEY